MLFDPLRGCLDQAVELLCSDKSGLSPMPMQRRDAVLIAQAFEFRTHKTGDVIADGGIADNQRFGFMVVHGGVRAMVGLAGHTAEVVGTVDGPGALSGLGHLFSEGPRLATYEVLGPTVIAVLERRRLAQLIQDHPRSAAVLMAKMSATYHVALQTAVKRYLFERQTARSLAAELEQQAIDKMPHVMRLAAFGRSIADDAANAP